MLEFRYQSLTLKYIEIGLLLPQNFKFVRTGIPVSVIQEEKLQLQKCIGEKESGKVFSLSIQVHNCWFSHDVTKFQTSEISILQKFYFHAV